MPHNLVGAVQLLVVDVASYAVQVLIRTDHHAKLEELLRKVKFSPVSQLVRTLTNR